MKKLAITLITLICATPIFAQNITADTTLANQQYTTANDFLKQYELDSALLYAEKAQKLYVKHLGEKSLKNANILKLKGLLNYFLSELDASLAYFQRCLTIKQEILGEVNIDVANAYNNVAIVYSDKSEYDKALEYYTKSLKIKINILGENNTSVADTYNNIGTLYFESNKNSKALDFFFKALAIEQTLTDINLITLARLYGNIGGAYRVNFEFEKALKYNIKSLDIMKTNLGDKHPYIALNYDKIGLIYESKAEYDKALKYYLKSLKIRLELFGEKNINVANTYNNIANVYNNKAEYNKALEYLMKSLSINTELLNANNNTLTNLYDNIGNIYISKLEYDKALEFYSKSLEIRLHLFGEKNTGVADSYNDLGVTYANKLEYDKALEYYLKSLEININLFGEKHLNVAANNLNIGKIYITKHEYNKALKYTSKSLEINLKLLGKKHTDVAESYNNMAVIYSKKQEYDKALGYFQKEIASCLNNFNDTINIYSIPVINDYLDWNLLLKGLSSKAKRLADTTKILSGIENRERLEIALKHYQACDTLITQVRKEITTKSDKLALGEKASDTYKSAIDICNILAKKSDCSPSDAKEYKELAFYFSEKNKSAVLQESMAEAEAKNFAEIPDSLLNLEHDLSINIATFTNLKNNAQSDSLANVWNSRLFTANCSYDSLITVLETQYPKYYDLKFNNSTIAVDQLQQVLDKKTALFSYAISNSTITIFALTNTNYLIKQVNLPADFDNFIKKLRNFLSNQNASLSRGIQPFGFKKQNTLKVQSLNEMYNTLFPDNILADLQKNNSRKISKLIIIPDGKLASIPFEILTTTTYNSTDNIAINYSQMPFLIKDYSISYSYSASLLYNTLYKKTKKQNSADWIGFAPVFDNQKTNGTTLNTRQCLSFTSDSLQLRSLVSKENYIKPLPGTKEETEEIFKLFSKKHKKATVKTYLQANEGFIKSKEMQNYRIIHLATHGFVNEENPKLSGILFAQDTTAIDSTSVENIASLISNQNEGILYQSELYNCTFNADLTVLSACETGLGKITKGEGVVGLTQALLYAGSRNLLVSLWQVSDKSTKELMIYFYKNLLQSKKQDKYSDFLRQAKLKMIKNGNFTHPYYWSSFVLIGE